MRKEGKETTGVLRADFDGEEKKNPGQLSLKIRNCNVGTRARARDA